MEKQTANDQSLQQGQQQQQQQQPGDPSSKQEDDVSEGSSDYDIPTDEVAAAVEQIKEDVQQSFTQTEHQLQQTAKSIRQQMIHFIRNYRSEFVPLIRRQRATSIQWWHDLNHQPRLAKLVLLPALLLTNVAAPLLFAFKRECWAVLFTYACVSIVSHFLYQLTPARSKDRFNTSLLSHLLWIPLLFWLSSRLASGDAITRSSNLEHVDVSLTVILSKSFWMSAWIRSVISVNCVVLACDVLRMTQLLQEQLMPQQNIAQGHGHGQSKPHISDHGDKHRLIDSSNEDDNIRQQEGIKQRLRSQAAPPTA